MKHLLLLFSCVFCLSATSQGQALVFDGSGDYIEVNNNFAGTYNQISVEGWFIIDEYPSFEFEKIFDFGGPTSRIVMQTFHDGSLNFAIEESNTSVDGQALSYSVPTDSWVHLAGVWNGLDSVILYLNGVIINANHIAPTINSLNIDSGSKMLIGARYNYQDYFDGAIESLSFWNRALSAGEINELMACPPELGDNGLLAYWPLDEGQGHSAGALGCSDCGGTIVGASWSTNNSGAKVNGCTDIVAENYDPAATCDNGSCEYTFGCTDPNACNYDEAATIDDGSCSTPTDIDLANQLSVDDGGQIVLNAPEGLTSFTWNDGSSAQQIQVGSGGEFILYAQFGAVPQIGDLMDNGLVFHIDTLLHEVYIATPIQLSGGVEYGCYGTETGASGTEIGDGINNTLAILAACGDPTSAASVASAVGDGWFLPSRDELDAIRTQLHETGIGTYSMNNPITYNWYWTSTECEEDPGSAAGSMHFYDGFYNVCNNKNSNPGGVIAAKRINGEFCFTSDTLFIASPCSSVALSSACGEGTIWDPVNEECISITPPFAPSCGEGTVWDPVNEECIIAIPADLNYDGCVSVSDLLELLTVHGTCPPYPEWPDSVSNSPCQGQGHVTYEGHDYDIVAIGEQCWFAENARYVSYVSPPHVGWEDDGGPHAYVVGYSGTSVDEAMAVSEYDTYGALYNFAAVEDSEMCPSGWHVPTALEWDELENFIGILSADKLKAAPPVWDGTNELGFNAIRVPVRISSGSFGAFNVKADFWTSTSFDDNIAWGRELNSGQNFITHDGNGKNAGQPVRCIKDQ